MSDSIAYLASLLAKYLGRKVMVLIDNYDAPINTIMVRGNSGDIDSAILFLKNLYSAVDKSPNVRKAVLMGTFRVAKTALLPAVREHLLLNHPLARRFGFHPAEVSSIFEGIYGLSSDKRALVRKRYGGYLTLTTLPGDVGEEDL